MLTRTLRFLSLGVKYVYSLYYCVSIGTVLCNCVFMLFVRRPTSGPWDIRNPR